jgi:hypothetical protein
MTLTAFGPLPPRGRREVALEGEALLAWLRPDMASCEVRWAPD